MEPHSARVITGGFSGGPSISGGASETGVEVGVGVGVDVGVSVGVGGTSVAVGGSGVGVDVGVVVGVEIRSGNAVHCANVGVSTSDPTAAPGTGRVPQRNNAATTPAAKLRAGSRIQPFPIL